MSALGEMKPRLSKQAEVSSTPLPASADEKPVLEIRRLRVLYEDSGRQVVGQRKQPVVAVDGVDLQVTPGETLGVVGESGSGKSSLALAIFQVVPASAGSVWFQGTDLATLRGRTLRDTRRHMQMIFQDAYSSLDPRMTVGQLLREPLVVHRVTPRAEMGQRVDDLLDLVGLSATVSQRFPHELSGGQRQRVAVARALAVKPEFILADEPFSALDVSVQAQIVNLLSDLQEALHLTYLVISHDLAVVRQISNRIAVMYLGKLVEVGPALDVCAAPRHPYTRALMTAVPELPTDQAAEQRLLVEGDIPSPRNPPSGCRFHTRCWLSAQLGHPSECRTHEPPLAEQPGGRLVACHFALTDKTTPGEATVGVDSAAHAHDGDPTREE